MRYVVKLGGAGLETPELLHGSMRAIAELVLGACVVLSSLMAAN